MAAPEGPQYSEREHRLGKIDTLRSRGVNPYPQRFPTDRSVLQIRAANGDLGPDRSTGDWARIAGRLMAIRRHGGLTFASLQDSTGQIQLVVDTSVVGADTHHDFDDLDRGDWVGLAGTVMTTRRGELSLRVEKFQLLAKALRVPPHTQQGRILRIRHDALGAIRGHLAECGFTEVATPVLQTTTRGEGGTRPLRTHHTALDLDLSLRIGLRWQLMELIVGGQERVFEIGPVFRDERPGPRHNPEFTVLGTYQAFADYRDMMDLLEELIAHAARVVPGSPYPVLRTGELEIDLRPSWPRVRMADLIARHTGAQLHPGMPVGQARALLDQRGVPYQHGWGAGRLMTQLYDEQVRPRIRGPLLCLDPPLEVFPPARPHRDDAAYAERFELVVAGFAVGSGRSERNDPAGGDVEPGHLRALEYGLPPTGGLAIGVDRLVMLLAGVDSIREVLPLPTARPVKPVSGDTSHGSYRHSRVPTSPAPQGPSRWPLRMIAGLTAVGGTAQLLAVLPVLHERVRPVELALPPWFDTAGRVASVLIGLLLILLAGQLAKGKRAAWRIAVGLFAFGAVVHVLKGPHPVAVAVCLIMLAALLLTRGYFRAGPDPPSVLLAARLVPAYLAVVLGFGLVTLYLERDALSPPLSATGALATVLGGLIGLDGPYAYQHPRFAEFFPAALLALGVLGLAVLAVLLLRPLRAGRTHTDAERQHAQRLVRTYGWDTLAYFALRDDKSYFFGSDGEAMLAYTYLGGYALVSGDPIGAPESVPEAVDEFLRLCAERAWQPAFLAVREADFPCYAARGFRSFYLGDEAILRCDEFTLAGAARKSVRAAVRRVGRTHRFCLISESDAPARLVEQLNAISARWRGKAPERGFTMSLSQDIRGAGANPELLLCVAFDSAGAPGGFLRLVPVYGPDFGYTLDLMRHDPNAPNGMTEFLIAGTARELAERGVARLSMNFAVWGRLFADDIPFTPAQRLARRAVGALNPFFQIKSLRDFNAKFGPQWLPRVLAYRRPTDLARAGLLYASTEGFLTLPALGPLLVPRTPAPCPQSGCRLRLSRPLLPQSASRLRSGGRRWVVGVVGVVGVVAGCTMGGGSDVRAPGGGGSAASPTVFTPVVASVVAAPAPPVLGTDGRYHVLYELELTNAKQAPATLQSVQVLDADQPSRVITSYSGDAVVDRLRTLLPAPAENATIPPEQSRFLFVDLAFGAEREIPSRLVHHLILLGATNPGATEPGPLRYDAARLEVTGTVPVLGPPLRGAAWVAANGCCTNEITHRGSIQTVNGGFHDAQRYAIDWMRMDDQGRLVTGDPADVRSFVGYGSEVIAAADGTVVQTLDNLPDQPPGTLPDPSTITVDTVDGNHVVLDIGGGLYLFYAHLQPGSVAVQPGRRVSRGQLLGKLGNSGNTSAPHLHVHVMNGTSVLGSDGRPYVIDRFGLAGQVPAAQFEASPDLAGFFGQARTTPAEHRHQLPLDLQIINFPN